MPDLVGRVVQADLDALRPDRVPPFAAVRARRARRQRTRMGMAVTGCGLVLAAVIAASSGLFTADESEGPVLHSAAPPVGQRPQPRVATVVHVLGARPGDPALGRVVLPDRVASKLSDLPPADQTADLLAESTEPGGSLYLAGVTGSGRIRACTTSFTDSPTGADGGVSCSGGATVYGDLGDKAIGLSGSWSSEHPTQAILEGSAPQGTTRVVIRPQSGAPVEMAVSPSGARWGGRVFFVIVVSTGPTTVTALDARGRTTAAATSRAFGPRTAPAPPPHS